MHFKQRHYTYQSKHNLTSSFSIQSDPTRESKKETSCNLDVGLGVAIPIAFVAGMAFALFLAYCCLRRREKRGRLFRVAYERDLSSASVDGIDEA